MLSQNSFSELPLPPRRESGEALETNELPLNTAAPRKQATGKSKKPYFPSAMEGAERRRRWSRDFQTTLKQFSAMDAPETSTSTSASPDPERMAAAPLSPVCEVAPSPTAPKSLSNPGATSATALSTNASPARQQRNPATNQTRPERQLPATPQKPKAAVTQQEPVPKASPSKLFDDILSSDDEADGMLGADLPADRVAAPLAPVQEQVASIGSQELEDQMSRVVSTRLSMLELELPSVEPSDCSGRTLRRYNGTGNLAGWRQPGPLAMVPCHTPAATDDEGDDDDDNDDNSAHIATVALRETCFAATAGAKPVTVVHRAVANAVFSRDTTWTFVQETVFSASVAAPLTYRRPVNVARCIETEFAATSNSVPVTRKFLDMGRARPMRV
eukprot:m.302421 g.302421  ORF g.302421 m.302421 type:complete len:388 (-) comp15170_c0_seq1:345-1508(-)